MQVGQRSLLPLPSSDSMAPSAGTSGQGMAGISETTTTSSWRRSQGESSPGGNPLGGLSQCAQLCHSPVGTVPRVKVGLMGPLLYLRPYSVQQLLQLVPTPTCQPYWRAPGVPSTASISCHSQDFFQSTTRGAVLLWNYRMQIFRGGLIPRQAPPSCVTGRVSQISERSSLSRSSFPSSPLWCLMQSLPSGGQGRLPGS